MSVIDRRKIYWKIKNRGRQGNILSTPSENVLSAGSGGQDMGKETNIITTVGSELSTQPPVDAPIIPPENNDPGRVRIANSGSHKLIARLLRLIKKRFAYKPPSNEELAVMDEKQQLEALEPILKQEANAAEKRIINCLTRMNVCYMTKKNDKDIIRRVSFNRIQPGKDLIYFHIDTDHLPHGVSIGQLEDQDVVNNLSVAVGHKVNYRWNEKTGCWYILERASGTMGIPNHVNLVDMWERTPASKDNLTIPIGMGQNSKVIYGSLDDMTHLLIAGTTGGGKSNFLNVVLCTLIRRNKPDRLRLLLVDLKGGLEFKYYEGIPHLLPIPPAPIGIVYERDTVLPLLDWVISEGEKRMKILLKAMAKNIGEFNAHKTVNRMPHMVVVIDEWADVKLGSGGKETEEKLANAVQRMRAVGIHVIVCTQVPQSQVLGTLIKANLPAKFAFNCADLQGSMAILNNGRALNLKPKGRTIFRFQEEIEIQTPFISKTIIQETVAGAIEGKYGEASKCDVTPEEVRIWALQENNGWLTRDTLFKQFKHRGLSFHMLNSWLIDSEGKDFLIGSITYMVVPGDNNHPRRLIPKDESS